MPRLSRCFLRGGFICLAVGMLVGGLILVQKGTGRFPYFWVLLPAHVYLVLVGGVTQCALGVSYWILPRLVGKGRGNTGLAWASYWALNTALLLVALHPAVEIALGCARRRCRLRRRRPPAGRGRRRLCVARLAAHSPFAG